MRPGSIIRLATALLLAAGCGGGNRSVRAPSEAVAQTPPAIPERVFASAVAEKNLLLDNEEVARNYLRLKLVGLMVERLSALGYEPALATRLSTAGRLLGFGVTGHRERVFGTGAEPGAIRRVVLWDVQGKLEVMLADQDLDALGDRLAGLPMGSVEEAEKVMDFLERMGSLRPDPHKLDVLRAQVADAWAEALKPDLELLVTQLPAPEQASFQAFADAATKLRRFSSAWPAHRELAQLVQRLRRGALALMRAESVDAADLPALKARLVRILDLAGLELKPLLESYLRRDLELGWRNRLEQLATSAVPFPRVYVDFFTFLQEFPDSDFYPRLELLFLDKWVDYLRNRKVLSQDDLGAYLDESTLLEQRFPTAVRLPEIAQSLGSQCVRVLRAVKLPDLDALARVRDLLTRCAPFIAEAGAVDSLGKVLAAREAVLLHERDDRQERVDLRDLSFFRDWDQAIRGLPFGKPRQGWTGSGEFLRLWEQGRDTGAECRCSLDAAEPCRSFEAEGSHGGFEVVARFYGDALAGVDLCQVFTGTNLTPVYQFYARRMRCEHDQAVRAMFLSGSASDPARAQPAFYGAGLRVTLQRSTDSVTVRYQYQEASAARARDEDQAKAQTAAASTQARTDRIARGWKVDDCVRFACDALRGGDCTYTGKVRAKRNEQYEVLVTESERDPRAQGRYRPVQGRELFDCPETP